MEMFEDDFAFLRRGNKFKMQRLWSYSTCRHFLSLLSIYEPWYMYKEDGNKLEMLERKELSLIFKDKKVDNTMIRSCNKDEGGKFVQEGAGCWGIGNEKEWMIKK